MLKHVTYRSTSSLGRVSSDLSCRSSSNLTSDSISYKDDLPPSPELSLKGGVGLLSSDTVSLKDEPLSDTISLKGDLGMKSFSPDTISLHSSLSFTSLAVGRLSSRCSSTASLSDMQTTPVKIYLRSLRSDIEYKTLSLSSATTCRQLIVMLLAKFRLRHRDPNLFFVTMEVLVRGPGGAAPARQLLVLDDHARPAELQQCRPRGDARFSVGVRRGGLLRVHDSILMPGSQYKSLLVSYRTSSEELVQLLLNCYNNKENPNHYAIHEVVKNPYSDRPLPPDEFPLRIQSEWPRPTRHNYSFVLRRNLSYAFSLKSRLSWRRSLDQSSTDTESEHEEHNTTIGSLLSTSSVSSALSISSRSSLSSTTSESSDTSSSSGVSSASSLMTSPVSSPVKSPLFPGVPTSSSESNTSLKSGTGGGGGTFLASKPPSSATAFMKTTSSSSVSAPTTTTTTSTPITAPTPVPRTILNTNSTGNSKTLPLPPRTRSYTNSYCSCCPTKTTLSSTSSSSLKLHPSALTSTTLSALSTSLSSLLSRSVSIPSVDTGTSTPSSVPSPTSPPSSSILSSKPPINSTSNTLTTTASKAITTTTNASSSKPTINPTSNTITTTASKAVTTTTTASSSSNTTSTKQQEHQRSEFRGPPQPLRRSSCCRNLENCFYI